MDEFVRYVPTIALAIASIVWAIRQEGLLKSEREARLRLEEEINRYYATKEEVVRLDGAISLVASQLPDVKALLVRIEGKVDSFLVAAVRQSASRTVRDETRSS